MTMKMKCGQDCEVVNMKKGYLFKLFGQALGFGMTSVMTITFFTAYLSPSKSVLVTINSFGEAWIEAVAVPVILGITLIGLYYTLKEDLTG